MHSEEAENDDVDHVRGEVNYSAVSVERMYTNQNSEIVHFFVSCTYRKAVEYIDSRLCPLKASTFIIPWQIFLSSNVKITALYK